MSWLKTATLLQRSLSLSVLALVLLSVGFALLTRARSSRAAIELTPMPSTPTPLIPLARSGIPPIDASQPQETRMATFALG
jgi:hypothetical protein